MARRKADPDIAAEVIEIVLALVDSGQVKCATRRERAVAHQLKTAATALRALAEAPRGEPGPQGWRWGPSPRPGGGATPTDEEVADGHRSTLSELLVGLSKSPAEGRRLIERSSAKLNRDPSTAAGLAVLRYLLRADQDQAALSAGAGWATRRALGAGNQKRAGDPRVERILRLREEGLSFRAICRQLDAEGVPRFTNPGQPWPVASVQYVVRTYGPLHGEGRGRSPGV